MTETITTPTAPITGEALLQLCESLQGKSFADQCRHAGYMKLNKKGELRPDADGLKSALLAAHGHEIKPGGFRSRNAPGQLKVSTANVLTVSKQYLVKAGAKPGDAFDIEVQDDGTMILVLADASDEPLAPALPTVNAPVEDRVPALAA